MNHPAVTLYSGAFSITPLFNASAARRKGAELSLLLIQMHLAIANRTSKILYGVAYGSALLAADAN
jgi:hypothetical protein